MRRHIPQCIKHHPIVASIYCKYLDRRVLNLSSYIFVATTGRSGTLSLTEIFAAVDECIAFHEPSPKLVHDAPAGVSPSDYYKRKFDQQKIIDIKRSAIGYRHYVEVNHLFAKTFGEHAIRYFGDRIQLVHLVRGAQSVAESIYALNEIPGSSQMARSYWLDPAEETNLLDLTKILGIPIGAVHPFHKCLWYWYECEARILNLKVRYPQVFKATIRTNALNNLADIESMLSSLGIRYSTDKIREVVGTRKNVRTAQKQVEIDCETASSLAREFHFAVLQQVQGNVRWHFEEYAEIK